MPGQIGWRSIEMMPGGIGWKSIEITLYAWSNWVVESTEITLYACLVESGGNPLR